MHLSIIGAPGCGKTAVFQALSGIAVEKRAADDHVAVIDVPDDRIDELAKIFNPKKKVYTRITVSDTVGITEGDIRNDSVGAKSIQQMRGSDALLLVLRNFDDGRPVKLKEEFRAIYSEFIISDMIQIEGRLERMRKQGAKKDNVAVAIEERTLTECLAHLSDEKPLATAPASEGTQKLMNNFQFLSAKPMMVVANYGEDKVGEAETAADRLKTMVPGHIPVLGASGKIEAELALMSEDERGAFLKEFGIRQSVRGRIIRTASQLLGLISFLTVGEDECRAWPVRAGATAQDAAGVIHTDLAQKFIRAETVSYSDFIANGGFAECKKKGLWRLEGKGYVVRDGDILTIRAGN